MKKTILPLLTLILSFSQAWAQQQVATLDSLPLPGPDSYWNGSNSGSSISHFTDGNLEFVNGYYSSQFGGYWGGFAYSNYEDTVTPGALNQYAAITGKGYNGSSVYGVAYADYNPAINKIRFANTAVSSYPNGVYITNSTNTYFSLKDGDYFAKKFGGLTGNDPDYFAVQFTGWRNGSPIGDTVTFYLADYRDNNNANDYIVKDWRWVDLNSLGRVDSMTFSFISSDVGMFGINTPLYFCFDNFTSSKAPASINTARNVEDVHVYPNPATHQIIIDKSEAFIISNQLGQQMNIPREVVGNNTICDISSLSDGLYIIKGSNFRASFVKH